MEVRWYEREVYGKRSKWTGERNFLGVEKSLQYKTKEGWKEIPTDYEAIYLEGSK